MSPGPAITVEPVAARPRFHALREEWDGLLRASGPVVPFLTHTWFSCILEAYPDRPLRTLVAREGQRAVGIAPLWTYRRRTRGLPLRTVGFITCPETPMVDFICLPDRREAVLAAFLSHLGRGESGRWDALLLNQWPESSPHGPLLESLHRGSGGRVLTSLTSLTPVTPIHGSWETFLKTRSALFRKSRRGILNRMARRGGASVELVRADPDGEALREVLQLARRSWKEEQGVAITSRSASTEFFTRLTRAAGQEGWLHLWLLRLDGALAAMEYDLAHDGLVYALRTDYDEAAQEHSPGAYLEYHLLKRLFDEGYREYHAGPGLNAYKLRWADRLTRNVTVTLCASTPAGRAHAWIEGPIARAWRRWRGERSRDRARDGWRAEADAAVEPVRPAAAVLAWLARRTGILALGGALADRFRLARGPGGRIAFPYVRRYRGDRYQVLAYHRVNDEHAPFFRATGVREFTAQMELVRERFRALPLAELFAGAAQGTLPPRSVGITFDDGYRDNFEHAFPVLRRLGLPATVFLATAPLDGGRPLWHDRVFDAFARSQADTLLWGTERLPLDTYAARGAALRTVLAEMKRARPEQRDALIDRVVDHLGVDEDPALGRRMLDWESVETMAEGGIAFGAHTVTHPILTRLSHAEARQEIEGSKRRIEERLGHPVRWFAYPNGTRDDWNDAVKAMLRDAGFDGALTTLWGTNERTTDPYELRRVGLWEPGRDRWALRLAWNQFAS